MSMQQIMRWGHDFPKDKKGEIFNLWGQWGKPNLNGRTHQTINYLSCLIHPIISFCRKLVEVVIAWGWEEYRHEFRIWGKPIFWGKLFLNFGARKHWKCMPIFPYTHVLHFLMQGKLGSCFTFTFLLIFLVLHAQKSILVLFSKWARNFSFWEFMAVIWFL